MSRFFKRRLTFKPAKSLTPKIASQFTISFISPNLIEGLFEHINSKNKLSHQLIPIIQQSFYKSHQPEWTHIFTNSFFFNLIWSISLFPFMSNQISVLPFVRHATASLHNSQFTLKVRCISLKRAFHFKLAPTHWAAERV